MYTDHYCVTELIVICWCFHRVIIANDWMTHNDDQSQGSIRDSDQSEAGMTTQTESWVSWLTQETCNHCVFVIIALFIVDVI